MLITFSASSSSLYFYLRDCEQMGETLILTWCFWPISLLVSKKLIINMYLYLWRGLRSIVLRNKFEGKPLGSKLCFKHKNVFVVRSCWFIKVTLPVWVTLQKENNIWLSWEVVLSEVWLLYSYTVLCTHTEIEWKLLQCHYKNAI